MAVELYVTESATVTITGGKTETGLIGKGWRQWCNGWRKRDSSCQLWGQSGSDGKYRGGSTSDDINEWNIRNIWYKYKHKKTRGHEDWERNIRDKCDEKWREA